jgi:hypothetical protein
MRPNEQTPAGEDGGPQTKQNNESVYRAARFRAALEHPRDRHTAEKCPWILRLRQRIAERRRP